MKSHLRALLTIGMNPLQLRLHQRILEFLEQAMERMDPTSLTPTDEPEWILRNFMGFVIAQQTERMVQLRRDLDRFEADMARAQTQAERHQFILAFSTHLGATPREWRADSKALERWLDGDAMRERCQMQMAAARRVITFCLERLATVCQGFDSQDASTAAVRFARMAPHTLAPLLLKAPLDEATASRYLLWLASTLEWFPNAQRLPHLDGDLWQYVCRLVLERSTAWPIQKAALHVVSLCDSALLEQIAALRLAERELGESIFIRCGCLQLLGKNAGSTQLFKLSLDDPAPLVRQTVATMALEQNPPRWDILNHLLRNDSDTAVIGHCLIALEPFLVRADDNACALIVTILASQRHPFVLRCALHTIEQALRLHVEMDPGLPPWWNEIHPAVAHLHGHAPLPATRRQAARLLEQAWLAATPSARQLWLRLLPQLQKIPCGKSRIVRHSIVGEVSHELLGRVLALAAADDMGFFAQRSRWGWEIQRGHEWRWRFWRFLHEWRHPSPDKRQAFPHTRGRYYFGHVLAPAQGLAELTATKVPGEPVVIPEENGWRPFLPLLDQVLSALHLIVPAPTVSIFSSDGITHLTPPSQWWRRLRARLIINWRFARLAARRNWRPQTPDPPDHYLQELRTLGIAVRFQSHDDSVRRQSHDSDILRFFPALLPPLPQLIAHAREYFVSVFENSFLELILFCSGAVAIFIMRQWWSSWRQRQRRDAIPLVIGGWGTRGKSGSERIKAALFNGQGLGVVSKTTGSDATFLHAWPGGRLYEIPLFRPYDRATIWEQHAVTAMAQQLRSEVLLWECMALQPDYVEVLQHDWMRDDLSTLTNAYPDHEDVMGPAGIDIPQVMTRFIPRRATLITSEEQMLPILADSAQQKATAITAVGWLQAGLLTEDVLARFPYAEHPYNVAMVLEMAKHLGIDAHEALRTMADRAVPEIGMLKTYPRGRVAGREIEFTNGMAANERVGCLSNWQRLHFDSHDPDARPDEFISVVVNNRADRIPRSRVFAQMVVEDLVADRYFLIGTNLNGLLGYIQEAWQDHVDALLSQPCPANQTPWDFMVSLWEQMARRLRRPRQPQQVAARLQAMLRNLLATPSLPLWASQWQEPTAIAEGMKAAGCSPAQCDSILDWLARDRADLQAYTAIRQQLTQDRVDMSTAKHAMREQWQAWFFAQIVVVWDAHASGDAIIETITQATPPGFLNRIMGVQNIKGTGYGFVTAWLEWAWVHSQLSHIISRDPIRVGNALDDLSNYQNYGILSLEPTRRTIAELHDHPLVQNERAQARLLIIRSHLDEAAESLSPNSGNPALMTGKSHGFFLSLLNWFEAFLDVGDAVRRRRQARAIYADLGAARISHPRAISELNALNKRQKGGWLLSQWQNAMAIFRRDAG